MMCFKAAVTCSVLAIGLAGAAFAQNQGGSSPSAGGATTMKDTGKGPGMSDTGMSGMNMQQMMAHCADMREQVKEKKPISADMQAMLKKCDDMDRQMQMPSGTKSR